jgi:hypothetical protein
MTDWLEWSLLAVVVVFLVKLMLTPIDYDDNMSL